MDKIVSLLLEHYPEGKCALSYRTPFELLVASRLSAQCTDVRVNIVTEALFAKYKTPQDFCDIPLETLERYIHSCGLFHTKAVDIKSMSERIVSVYGGEVPSTMEDLLSLRGVGRKIANLIMGEVYGEKGVIVADTHCIRLANRLGLADSANPSVVEKELRKKIPPDKSLLFCHALVSHGRQVCRAQCPGCAKCFLNGYCRYYKEAGK